ncbi:MAG: c-type cytochrome biogenesis protein CcmI [Roseovarius sp.]
MLFWIVVVSIALFSGALLALAVLKGRVGAEPPAAYDLRIYRDQLKEVDRDRARGVIGEAEAERLRAEVSRRILAADAQLQKAEAGGDQPRVAGLAMAALALAGVAGGGLWLYSVVGAPGYADLPLKTRIAASDERRLNRLSQAEAEAQVPAPTVPPEASEEYLALMERLRQTVAERPDDVRGLGLLVRNEAALGNLSAAHKAQAQLIEAKGEEATARDHAILADLMVSAAAGYVSAEAREVLREALELNPQEPRARYYLGLYLWQVDRPDSAFRIWDELLKESRPDAPWVPLIRSRIEEVAWRAGVTEYTLPPLPEDAPGPSAADIEAAQDMSAEDRAQMIRGMVDRLSDRLASEGGTAEEWARLIGALGVLGERERAQEVWEEAQQVFAGRDEALAALRAAAQSAGLAE